MDYFDFLSSLKTIKLDQRMGHFPQFQIGQYQVSLQAGRRNKFGCKQDEVNTLAQYNEFDLELTDENGPINIYQDRRFRNIPYRDYYYSVDRSMEKVYVEIDHVFEILSYLEQMDVEADSYRNKKFYISMDTVAEHVDFTETTDKEINQLLSENNFNFLDLYKEKYVGIYEQDKGKYLLIRREYRFHGKYRYFGLYPKEIEDLIRFSVSCPMFTEKIRAELITKWNSISQSRGILYQDNWTWINEMEGEFFDCSANQFRIYDWLMLKKGLPLALMITTEGRVREIYGDRDSFLMYLNSMQQNLYLTFKGNLYGRKFMIQHYNYSHDPRYLNRFVGEGRLGIYGDALLMCTQAEKPSALTGEDLKWLFENGFLNESLKKKLFAHVFNELFNEEYRQKKRQEEFNKRTEKIIARAKSVNLPDGIFKLVCYNNQARVHREEHIDIYQVYADQPQELIASWIEKAKFLLRTNYDVGDAIINRAHLANQGDQAVSEEAQKRYERADLSFRESNPGFSEETYQHAMHLGAIAAR